MTGKTEETQDATSKAGDTSATPDLSKAADGLVAKHGDSTAALKVLLGENHQYRDQIRDLKAKLPKEGSVVLSDDDAKLFARYKTLGDVKTLETALSERDQYREESDGFKREKLHADVAAVAGFKPAVFSRLATTDGLDLAVREAKDKAGKPVKVAVVVSTGDDGKTTDTPLVEYAETHWGEFLPALRPDGQIVKKPTGTPQHRPETPPRPQADGTADVARRSVLRGISRL